jgi:hypothetical protein
MFSTILGWKKQSELSNDGYTILLQGRIDKKTLKLWIKNHKDSKVILSIWEDEDLSKFNIPTNWKVVVNQYPLIRFAPTANLDYQIITTIKGLNEVKTKWVIKLRCDEYWSNLDKIYDKMLKWPEKLISGSMFFRDWGTYTKFHPSDKIIGGTLDNVMGMFESTLHNLEMGIWSECKTPESQLGLGYVMLKDLNFELKSQLQLRSEKKKLKYSEEEKIKIISNGLSVVSKEIIDIIMDDFRNKNTTNINWNVLNKRVITCKDILLECVKTNELDDIELIDDKPYMRKWFDIIDVNELKPYIATRNFGPDKGRVWYNNDFVNEKEECLTNVNDD